MAGRARSDGSGLFCPNCGNGASPDHDYCIHCGHDLTALKEVASGEYETETGGASSSTQTQRSSITDDNVSAFRKRVSYLVSSGWEIEYDGHDEVVLVDRGLGSIWVHILLLPFTSGVGNLLYGWYHYSVSPTRVTLRADGNSYEVVGPQQQQTTETTETETEPRTSPLDLAGAVTLLVIGVLIGVSGGLSLFTVLFSLAFVLVGLYLLPPVRRRIRDRHTLTTFGSTETVDERYVEKTDRPCTSCGARVVDGVIREYEQEYVFGGIPLYTMERGENYYCQSCQHLETGHGTEASRGVEDVDVDESAFEDSIERELERLREDDEETDSSTPQADTAETTETEPESKTD